MTSKSLFLSCGRTLSAGPGPCRPHSVLGFFFSLNPINLALTMKKHNENQILALPATMNSS